jgi:hypothetical protein
MNRIYVTILCALRCEERTHIVLFWTFVPYLLRLGSSLLSPVEACQPPLDGLTELVTKLNKDNDFSAFIRAIRRKFKERI